MRHAWTFIALVAPLLGRAPQTDAPVLVCLGDSLTAGFGLAPEQAYPALLQQRLQQAGMPWRVVNAGVSGDTTAGGLRRLDWALKQGADVLLVALGANDGLRGIPPDVTARNLQRIIQKAQQRGIRVVLAGMKLPDNYGRDHQRRFEAIFPTLAKEHRIPLIPFLLEGVAMRSELNQDDRIHPNAEGQKRVAALLWKALEPELKKVSPRTGAAGGETRPPGRR